jgi:hypothetical protein
MGFRRARNIEFHFAEQLIVVINESDIHFNGFADTGIRKVVGDAFPIGFVGQLFADLGEIVLAIGILNVGNSSALFCTKWQRRRNRSRVARISAG